MQRIDYIILYVADLESSVAFYRDVVGLAFKLWGDGYAEFATEGTRFALFDRSHAQELTGGRDASGEIVLVVGDVDAEAERLRRAGAEILSGPQDRPWGHRTVHIAGPDAVRSGGPPLTV